MPPMRDSGYHRFPKHPRAGARRRDGPAARHSRLMNEEVEVADEQIQRRLSSFQPEDRHLSFFLAFLVLMTIFVPMVGESRPGRIAIDLTFSLMLLSGAIVTVYN